MKLQLLVLSDLYLECAGFAPDLDGVRACDVVVLASDIHPGIEGLRWARASFPRKPVVYVAGKAGRTDQDRTDATKRLHSAQACCRRPKMDHLGVRRKSWTGLCR